MFYGNVRTNHSHAGLFLQESHLSCLNYDIELFIVFINRGETRYDEH